MIQNSLIISAIVLSANSFAQKTPNQLFPVIKENSFNTLQLNDSLAVSNLMDVLKTKKSLPMITMPNAKPKDLSVYAALIGKVRNDQLYRILNSIPEKERLNKK